MYSYIFSYHEIETDYSTFFSLVCAVHDIRQRLIDFNDFFFLFRRIKINKSRFCYLKKIIIKKKIQKTFDGK